MSGPTITADEKALRVAFDASKNEADVAGAMFRRLAGDEKTRSAMADYQERLRRENDRHRTNLAELAEERWNIQNECPHLSVEVVKNKTEITGGLTFPFVDIYAQGMSFKNVDVSSCSLCGKELGKKPSVVHAS